MNASAKTLIIFEAFWALSFVNSNTWNLICNNFNLNFIYRIVCLYVCVCAFSLYRESPDMILGDEPIISEVVLSQPSTQKTLTMDPLGGAIRDPGVLTINAKNVDDGPPGRRCRRSWSIHHQRGKRRWRAPGRRYRSFGSTHHQH
jgi:hypothetical protein